MAETELRGVLPYLISPVTDTGEINADILARLVDHLVDSGVHGLVPLGSTGEFAYLTWGQRYKVVEVVVEANAGRVPVVAGVAATSTREAVGHKPDLRQIQPRCMYQGLARITGIPRWQSPSTPGTARCRGKRRNPAGPQKG